MKIKNLKIRKKLVALALAGTLALTSTGCGITSNFLPNKYDSGDIISIYTDDDFNSSYKTLPESNITNVYGLHDADWQSSFGGTVYERRGSHGCVNIPPELTDDVYDSVKVGTKVLVHK